MGTLNKTATLLYNDYNLAIVIIKGALAMHSNTKKYSILGLLVGMCILLSYVTIGTGIYKIGLGYVPTVLMGYLFGPYWGAIGSLTAHLLKSILNPNVSFFPGYIIDALLIGYIYGKAFYNKKITFKRVLVAMVIAQFSTAVILDPIWNHVVYKTPILAQATVMAVKNTLVVPLYSLITYGVLKNKVLKRVRMHSSYNAFHF